MASVVLFHSVLGLRQVELEAAARMRDEGHDVLLPDLFNGSKTEELDEGFAIKASIGWNVIRERASTALAGFSETAVLAGISMGAGVVGEMWPSRPNAGGVLLLHGLSTVPEKVRAGTPIQLHVSEHDPFFPGAEVRAWQTAAQDAGLSVDVFTYERAGHYFMDRALPDYSEEATAALWPRLLPFLRDISASQSSPPENGGELKIFKN
jgi:dienelactone hydrolase